MKIRLAAIALILVGVGAVVLAVAGPSFGSTPSSKYITSTVSTGTVSAQSVANGSIAASTVYGLKFGASADIVSSASTTSGGGGSTSSSSSSTASLAWPVLTVTATVGQTVTKGTPLATADTTAAQLLLASAQATLASAQSKLATDQGGPDALTLAQAKNSLSQSYNSYSQSVANRNNTNASNALKLSQSQAAVTAAQDQLTADQAAPIPDPVAIAKDQNTLATAQQNLASTQLSVNQSNVQAAQQVTTASLNYQAAQLSYQAKVSPAATATVQADQAAVASAQATVNADQAAVTNATLLAPADGLIIAVNILPGVNAPSGYAVEISVGPMVATASFAESDVASLKVGQSATVSVTGAKVSVAGTLTQIVPVASASGGASSVATYAVTVTLTSPPETVLAGMSSSVTVTTASVDNALRVPATALQGSSTAGYSVLVMNSDGSTTSKSVQVGLVTSSMAQVTGGLKAGDTVVTGTLSSRTGTTTTGAGAGGVNVNSLTGGGGFGGFGR
jgi:multidrug efflux pump subunit AcrA (membrane-fusion protein)